MQGPSSLMVVDCGMRRALQDTPEGVAYTPNRGNRIALSRLQKKRHLPHPPEDLQKEDGGPTAISQEEGARQDPGTLESSEDVARSWECVGISPCSVTRGAVVGSYLVSSSQEQARAFMCHGGRGAKERGVYREGSNPLMTGFYVPSTGHPLDGRTLDVPSEGRRRVQN